MSNDDLTHAYSSKYYDPVKAHEYYEKTKQLKGRRSARRLNANQKVAWKYVKEGINTEKKQKIESNKLTDKANIERLRAEIALARERIAAKIKNSDLTRAGAKGDREALTNKLKSTIDGIRQKTKQFKETLNVATEDILDREYQKILNEVR